MDAISPGTADESAGRRAGRGGWRRLGWALIFLAAPLVAEAIAVKAEVIPLATRTRSDAPSLVEVKIKQSGVGLLQGRLELTLSRNGSILAVVRSQELAVTPTGLSLRMVLPPLRGNGELEIGARFLTDRGVLPAGESRLWSLPSGGQTFLVAVVGAHARSGEGEVRLWQQLRLERFMDPAKASSANWSTTPAFLEVAELPEAALAWCAFDLVLLEGESFARLRRRQLDALVQWVEGGGSVFLVGAGTLSAEHLDALHRLVSSPPGVPPLALDAAGRLIPPATPLTLARPELGRCVLAPAPPSLAADYDSFSWREATAFLWKVGTTWNKQVRKGEYWIDPFVGTVQPWSDRENHVHRQLASMLPQTVRMLPLGVVAALLTGFVVAVGPGEWFLLGWLRLRRWTWVVFPLLAAGFTGATVLAANHYLGRGDFRAAIIISDLGRHGQVLRESQIEMVMQGHTGDYQEDLTRAFKVPTNLGSIARSSSAQPAEPPVYEGQHPLRFVFHQPLKQWEPRILRTFSFEAAPPAEGIDWEGVTARELAAAEDPVALFTERCHAGAFGVHIFYADAAAGSSPWVIAPSEMIDELIQREHGLLGKIVTAFAPSGDADCADLVSIDRGDSAEWVVVVFVRRGHTLQIFRHTYRSDE